MYPVITSPIRGADMIKMDETNIAIIKHLRDGRRSFKKIAEDLGLTENTVRSRVNKLREEGVLDITGLVDAAAIPGHTVVMLGVKLNTMHLVKKGEEFSRLRGVISVSVVTGRYDLIIIALLKEDFGPTGILHQGSEPGGRRPVNRNLCGLSRLQPESALYPLMRGSTCPKVKE